MKTKEYVIPQVRMFFKAEGRANLFDMLRRIKTSARQTYTRCGTGSVVSRSLSVVEVRQYTRRLLTSFREAASSVPYK